MRYLLIACIVALLVACTPSAEQIEPAPDRRELGQQGVTAVAVPLSWHASEHWKIDPLYGAATRALACGVKEPSLRPLALEVDAASVPSGATIMGVTLVIDPCDQRGPWLPDNLPATALFSVDFLGNATQLASAAQDASPNAAAYSQLHEINMPLYSTPVLVNREKHRYMVLLEPEYGLDAVGGTRVNGLVVDLILP